MKILKKAFLYNHYQQTCLYGCYKVDVRYWISLPDSEKMVKGKQ